MIDDEPSVSTVIVRAANRPDAMDAILAHMVEEGMIPLTAAAEIRDGIDQRHALLGSPSVGGGVVFPHLKHACADRPLLTLALLKAPNPDWESLDGEPVDLVFLIVTPFEPARSYQRYFERLQRALGAGLGERLRCAGTAEALAEVLRTLNVDRST